MIILLQSYRNTMAYKLIYSKRLTLHSCIRDISWEEHEQSMTASIVTWVLLVLQMGGGLQRINEAITHVIYHASWNARCIRRLYNV
jgi:hypothetical protein